MRLILLGIALGGLLACGDDESSTGPEIPDPATVWAADSLAAADTVRTESGLRYIEIEAGQGQRPGRGSIVSVHYTGLLQDGTVFDSSYPRGSPYRFVLGQGRVIAGWDEGIALMYEGSRGRLIIPAHLGYGDAGSGPIPGGATLLFDVWLVAVD